MSATGAGDQFDEEKAEDGTASRLIRPGRHRMRIVAGRELTGWACAVAVTEGVSMKPAASSAKAKRQRQAGEQGSGEDELFMTVSIGKPAVEGHA